MKRLLVIGNSDFGINLFKTIVYGENIKNYCVSEREVQLRREDEFVKIEAVNKIVNEYDESERRKIPYESPKILMVTFSSIDFLKQVIEGSRLPEGIYIDDFKCIRSFDEAYKEICSDM